MSVSKDMADPDLQIRGGGGRSQNKIFWPFRPQSGLKMWAGPSPGSILCNKISKTHIRNKLLKL